METIQKIAQKEKRKIWLQNNKDKLAAYARTFLVLRWGSGVYQ